MDKRRSEGMKEERRKKELQGKKKKKGDKNIYSFNPFHCVSTDCIILVGQRVAKERKKDRTEWKRCERKVQLNIYNGDYTNFYPISFSFLVQTNKYGQCYHSSAQSYAQPASSKKTGRSGVHPPKQSQRFPEDCPCTNRQNDEGQR